VSERVSSPKCWKWWSPLCIWRVAYSVLKGETLDLRCQLSVIFNDEDEFPRHCTVLQTCTLSSRHSLSFQALGLLLICICSVSQQILKAPCHANRMLERWSIFPQFSYSVPCIFSSINDPKFRKEHGRKFYFQRDLAFNKHRRPKSFNFLLFFVYF
jgi:hypothetical protein